MDILQQCLTTIFLCSWTALCLNVPHAGWGTWRFTHQKNIMAVLCLLGPEFILQLAIGQWVSAKRSVREFKAAGIKQWTLRHAFMADMGGFRVHAWNDKPFLVDANQLLYLIEHGFVKKEAALVKKREITDKDKGDGMTRAITVLQMIYFTTNLIGRGLQRLVITTLELTTLTFIICTLGTYFFWAHKPLDVSEPITLTSNATITEIRLKAGIPPEKPWDRSPLEFIPRESWGWNLYWDSWRRALEFLRYPLASTHDRCPDDLFLPPNALGYIILCILQHAFASINLIGWNFTFPTTIERTLWRAFGLLVLGIVTMVWIVDQGTWTWLPFLKKLPSRLRNHHRKLQSDLEGTAQGGSFFTRLRGKLIAQPEWDYTRQHAPLKALIPVTICGALYCFCRLFIYVEDFLSLRAQPQSVYQTVNWNAFLPHF